MADALIIAAPASGSGKTLITLSLLALLRARGMSVSAAKTGPDYIDPAFHAAATGRPCINLDPWAMSRTEIAARLAMAAEGAETLIVEGVMGLFDAAADGAGSTADLAAMTGLPVVLVLDAARQGQSVAAVAAGFRRFRADVNVAGVILNRLATERHGEMLARAVEEGAGLPVVGRMMRHARLELPARHLGLVQAGEHEAMSAFLRRAARAAADGLSPERLLALARPPAPAEGAAPPRLPPLAERIAVARDEAFAFAYPHLLEDWRAQGAHLSFFSPLADEAPEADAGAVFLPGGYPELHAGRLAGAARFMKGLRAAAREGALIYGECGGYMTLGEALTDADGRTHRMAGLLPVSTSFAGGRLHLGYRGLTHAGPLPFPARLRGHEFHYAEVLAEGPLPPLFEATDSRGGRLAPMGLANGRVCGSFAHVISRAPETDG